MFIAPNNPAPWCDPWVTCISRVDLEGEYPTSTVYMRFHIVYINDIMLLHSCGFLQRGMTVPHTRAIVNCTFIFLENCHSLGVYYTCIIVEYIG